MLIGDPTDSGVRVDHGGQLGRGSACVDMGAREILGGLRNCLVQTSVRQEP